jgi:hypothetical protein
MRSKMNNIESGMPTGSWQQCGAAVVVVVRDWHGVWATSQELAPSMAGSAHSHGAHRFSSSTHADPLHVYRQCKHSPLVVVVAGAGVVVPSS